MAQVNVTASYHLNLSQQELGIVMRALGAASFDSEAQALLVELTRASGQSQLTATPLATTKTTKRAAEATSFSEAVEREIAELATRYPNSVPLNVVAD